MSINKLNKLFSIKVIRWARGSHSLLIRILGLFIGFGWIGNLVYPFIGIDQAIPRLWTITLRTSFMAETVLYIRLGQRIPAYGNEPARTTWGVDLCSGHLVGLVQRYVRRRLPNDVWYIEDTVTYRGCLIQYDGSESPNGDWYDTAKIGPFSVGHRI